MKTLLILSLITLLTACGGGSGGSSPVGTDSSVLFDDLDGVWNQTSTFKCYNSSLNQVTANALRDIRVARTLTISGQSYTLSMIQTQSNQVFCSANYSGNIFGSNNQLTLNNLSVTSKPIGDCVFSYNYPVGVSPTSEQFWNYNTGDLFSYSAMPYFRIGNTLHVPIPEVHSNGFPTDVCFDIYTK